MSSPRYLIDYVEIGGAGGDDATRKVVGQPKERILRAREEEGGVDQVLIAGQLGVCKGKDEGATGGTRLVEVSARIELQSAFAGAGRRAIRLEVYRPSAAKFPWRDGLPGCR
jgi:hypothetical protein